MPKVSVIIPLYNGKKFIKNTLNRVFNQSYKDFEVIVVNDGSTDNPENILKKYLPKIKYIVQPNSGCPAGAKNRGIRESAGEYLAFLDQDDLWMEDKLKIQVEVLDKYQSCGLVATNAIVFKDETKKKIGIYWKKAKRLLTSREARAKLSKENFIISSSAVMVRSSVFNKGDYFDERLKLADDYELWYRIAKKWSFALILKPLLYYRNNSQSLSKNKNKLFKDLIFINKIFSKDKNLTKEERKYALEQIALFNFRLANNCMTLDNYAEAKQIYRRLKKQQRFCRKIKIIESLNNISPKMAGVALKMNRTILEQGRTGPNLNITV